MPQPAILRRFGSARVVAAVALVALGILGCGSDGMPRSQPVDDTSVTRLTGTWDLTLTLDRPMTFSTDLKILPRSVNGTMAFAEDHNAQASLANLGGLTHAGVYDIRLDSLELPRWSSDKL